jgi:hypothetical protein
MLKVQTEIHLRPKEIITLLYQFSRNSQMQNGIARRSCVPNLIKIGHEILTVHVKVHSRSSVKYDYR